MIIVIVFETLSNLSPPEIKQIKFDMHINKILFLELLNRIINRNEKKNFNFCYYI